MSDQALIRVPTSGSIRLLGRDIPVSAMPVTERASRLLDRYQPQFEERQSMVPAAALPAVIAELEAALVPMDPATAPKLGALLASAWPNFRPADADGYARWVTDALSCLPLDVGAMVVLHLVKNLKWPPTICEISEAAETIVGKRERRLRVAHRMVERYKELADQTAEQERRMQDRAARSIGDALRALGRPRPKRADNRWHNGTIEHALCTAIARGWTVADRAKWISGLMDGDPEAERQLDELGKPAGGAP